MRLAPRTLIMIALAIDAVRTTNALLLMTVAVRAAAAASSCTGKSASLTAADCGAWTDLWDATNGPGWKHCNDQASRLDPCSCGSNQMTCSGSHITYMYVRARGSPPAPFASPALCLRPASCHW